MNRKPQERGQALILIVFAAIALFAFAALAIDGSRVFSDRRHAQNAADTSVLAAALAKVRGNDHVDAAQKRALSNGFENGVNSTVEVHLCDEAGLDPTCEGLPTGSNPAEYIQVVIRMVTPTTFARIIGFNEVPTVVTAVARASGTSSSATSSGNVAIFATKNGVHDQCFLLTGGGGVVTHDSGIMVNCEGNQAMFLNGGANLEMDSPGQIAGCHNSFHNVTPVDLASNLQCNIPPQTVNASTFASVPTTQPAPSCGPAVTSITNPLTPGTYTTSVINTNTTFQAGGVYCFPNGLTVLGATLNDTGGNVKIVLQNQGLTALAHSALNFTDLEIYSVDGGFTTASNSSVDAARLRYFSTGNGTVQVNGNAELRSTNSYFYLHQGDIILNGQALITLHGPPPGDPFGGLLIHKPYTNTIPISLNGGSNHNLTGTFMAPGSPFSFNGNTDFVLHSQIIGSTFSVNGHGNLEIFYDPSENYSPPNSPLIQLTK